MGNKGLAGELHKMRKKEVIDLRKMGIQALPSAIGALQCKTCIIAENDIVEIPEDIQKMTNLQVMLRFLFGSRTI